ncbi:L-idonate 5-dehydrogenase [Geminicoccaceae bacterium 1502E]|nr:L-idonate 5-dehydrogenase [Geminicoccaceae bacterium 1502E]
MKACVIHAAHDLRVEEREPAGLGPGEIRVRLGAGGICGSDLHYYHEGGIGDFPVREPMVLGHEMAGTVAELGPGVEGPAVGTRVAVDPTWPCGACRWCRDGSYHLCPEVRFAGSSRTFPHTQGFFQELVTAKAAQCKPLPEGFPLELAAMAEPLAVCLHAVQRAGNMVGQRVLVTGAGPIGCLTVVAARLAGAAEITATDLLPEALAVARRMGADRTIDLAADRTPLDALQEGGGKVDIVFECSGSPKALVDGLKAVRRGGTMVQVGVLPRGGHALPVDLLVGKELDLKGTLRFTREFDWAVSCIVGGRVDLRPLLTDQLPLARARDAFDLASDRKRAMKVQLVLS